MTAMAKRRAVRAKRCKQLLMPAAASVTYYQGALVGFDTAGTGLIIKGAVSATFVPIGLVAEDTVLGAGGGSVLVDLFEEKSLAWFVNATAGDACAATDVGKLCYVLDDQTVAANDATNTRSVAGRIWGFDSAKGVLVEARVSNGDRLGGLDA